jgi:hypothetical protein
LRQAGDGVPKFLEFGANGPHFVKRRLTLPKFLIEKCPLKMKGIGLLSKFIRRPRTMGVSVFLISFFLIPSLSRGDALSVVLSGDVRLPYVFGLGRVEQKPSEVVAKGVESMRSRLFHTNERAAPRKFLRINRNRRSKADLQALSSGILSEAEKIFYDEEADEAFPWVPNFEFPTLGEEEWEKVVPGNGKENRRENEEEEKTEESFHPDLGKTRQEDHSRPPEAGLTTHLRETEEESGGRERRGKSEEEGIKVEGESKKEDKKQEDRLSSSYFSPENEEEDLGGETDDTAEEIQNPPFPSFWESENEEDTASSTDGLSDSARHFDKEETSIPSLKKGSSASEWSSFSPEDGKEDFERANDAAEEMQSPPFLGFWESESGEDAASSTEGLSDVSRRFSEKEPSVSSPGEEGQTLDGWRELESEWSSFSSPSNEVESEGGTKGTEYSSSRSDSFESEKSEENYGNMEGSPGWEDEKNLSSSSPDSSTVLTKLTEREVTSSSDLGYSSDSNEEESPVSSDMEAWSSGRRRQSGRGRGSYSEESDSILTSPYPRISTDGGDEEVASSSDERSDYSSYPEESPVSSETGSRSSGRRRRVGRERGSYPEESSPGESRWSREEGSSSEGEMGGSEEEYSPSYSSYNRGTREEETSFERSESSPTQGTESGLSSSSSDSSISAGSSDSSASSNSTQVAERLVDSRFSGGGEVSVPSGESGGGFMAPTGWGARDFKNAGDEGRESNGESSTSGGSPSGGGFSSNPEEEMELAADFDSYSAYEREERARNVRLESEDTTGSFLAEMAHRAAVVPPRIVPSPVRSPSPLPSDVVNAEEDDHVDEESSGAVGEEGPVSPPSEFLAEMAHRAAVAPPRIVPPLVRSPSPPPPDAVDAKEDAHADEDQGDDDGEEGHGLPDPGPVEMKPPAPPAAAAVAAAAAEKEGKKTKGQKKKEREGKKKEKGKLRERWQKREEKKKGREEKKKKGREEKKKKGREEKKKKGRKEKKKKGREEKKKKGRRKGKKGKGEETSPGRGMLKPKLQLKLLRLRGQRRMTMARMMRMRAARTRL